MSIKHKTIYGLFWSSIERFSSQIIQFVIGIIIARLLAPTDYGLIGMLAIFLAISQSFIDSGFSNALIIKKNRTEADFSTVFYFNIFVGLFFYIVLFFTSGLIADFYNSPILENLTKVVGITLFINSLTVVQRAKLTIVVDFKTQAKASIISVIISGIIGIWMAYSGYGVWALAYQSVANGLVNMIMIWAYSKWKPKRIFSWTSFRELFSFGSKLLLSGLIDTIYKNIYTIVIGKKFSAHDLGFYTRSDQLAQFPSSNISNIFSRVIFPILSSIQTDDDRLQDVYRKYLRLSAFIIFPLMAGFAALASPFINLLLTPKWDGAVLILQILCFAYMWYPIHSINLNLLQVKGRSDLFLRLEIIKKIIGFTILLITIPMGIIPMCIGLVINSIICLTINTHYTGKLINVGFVKQMKDLLPTLFYSTTMSVIVWLSIMLVDSNLLKLLLGFVIGTVYYFGIAYISKSKEIHEILSIIKPKK
ncbi:MAG: polysaccharide biosynthesis protein [Bacteroidetes bacterium]|nr:polysaccharide biosynthesis protein [Bacteroidota bacterium]